MNATARFHFWLARVIVVLCLPAFALAADCSCALPTDGNARGVVSACAGTADSCRCACCCRKQQAPPSKAPTGRAASPQRIIGILFGLNLRSCSAPSLPFRAVAGPAADPALSVGTADAPMAGTLTAGAFESLPRAGIPHPSVFLWNMLRRCHPGNAPPLS